METERPYLNNEDRASNFLSPPTPICPSPNIG